MSVGIFIADLLVRAIGTGTWQVGVVTGLAMLAATLVGGGTLLASQAGASAVLVATLQPPEGVRLHALARRHHRKRHGARSSARCCCPIDPVRLVREGLGPVVDRLAAVLGLIADALEHRDARDAERALAAVGRVDAQYDHLTETLSEAGDAARISLSRRGSLTRLDRYVVAVGELGPRDREHARARPRRDARHRARRLDAARGAGRDPRARHRGARAGHAARGRRRRRPRARRRCALCGSPTPCWRRPRNLSAVHIVGQVRLVAVDLLRAGGVPRAEAQEAVRSAPAEPLEDPGD